MIHVATKTYIHYFLLLRPGSKHSVFWGMMIFLLQLSTFRTFNNGVEDELDDSGGACCPKLLGSFSMYAQRKLCAHSLILCMRKKMWDE
jgi:hypothetical protein